MNSPQRTPERLCSSLWTKEEHIEQLAKDIHRHYRAAFKALHKSYVECQGDHDHGWAACGAKKYFRQRAARELRGKL